MTRTPPVVSTAPPPARPAARRCADAVIDARADDAALDLQAEGVDARAHIAQDDHRGRRRRTTRAGAAGDRADRAGGAGDVARETSGGAVSTSTPLATLPPTVTRRPALQQVVGGQFLDGVRVGGAGA